jgi:hypothetical protein
VLPGLPLAGHSAHIWVREVEAALEKEARDVIALEIGEEIAAQLDSE